MKILMVLQNFYKDQNQQELISGTKWTEENNFNVTFITNMAEFFFNILVFQI